MDPISISKSSIKGIRTILSINATVLEKLFNENQDLKTQIDEMVEKHKLT